MKSKYQDTTAVLQVIGSILVCPEDFLEEEGTYFYNEADFTEDLHRVVFSAASNLYQQGAKKIDAKTIEDYLMDNRPASLAIYLTNNGMQWVTEVANCAETVDFDYYYMRMKKMTLLRSYEKVGMDLTWLYDPDILDPTERQRQKIRFDNYSLNELADVIDNRILDIREMYVDNATDGSSAIGDGIFELLAGLNEQPEMGAPLYGPYINTITRGARLGKFYLRSAATGVGKSRTMMADACNMACNKIYDTSLEKWVDNGEKLDTLFISVELEPDELKTMALAFLSGVNESHILDAEYLPGEQKRVEEAAQVLMESPLYIEYLPDYSLKDIENTIKRSIRLRKTQYIFLDYIATSMKIIEEIASRSSGMKLREDNILFLLSSRLKDICCKYDVHIFSSTQLNAAYKSEEIPDQNLLRGSKAVADRIDVGMILLDITEQDKQAIANLVTNSGYPMPNVKLSIYKNRRGAYTKCYLWMNADKSTCRYRGLFMTDYQYNPLPIADTKIKVVK